MCTYAVFANWSSICKSDCEMKNYSPDNTDSPPLSIISNNIFKRQDTLPLWHQGKRVDQYWMKHYLLSIVDWNYWVLNIQDQPCSPWAHAENFERCTMKYMTLWLIWLVLSAMTQNYINHPLKIGLHIWHHYYINFPSTLGLQITSNV